MKKLAKAILQSGFALSLLCSTSVYAQEYGNYATDGYNHQSIRPVHESHMMYKQTLWHRFSLKEKQNTAFFARGSEITALLIDAVKLGIIRPYKNDSIRTRMTQEEFLQNLIIPSESVGLTPEEIEMGFPIDEGWDTSDCWGEDCEENASTTDMANEFFANQLYLMEMKSELLFDKNRSRMLNDIQTISLILPAEMNPSTGLEKTIAVFSYKEIVQNLFRDNQSAIHYNSRNNQAHLNLEHAFDLMLVNSRVIKYANVKDEYFIDMHEDMHQALLMAANYKDNLIEYESNLWEN